MSTPDHIVFKILSIGDVEWDCEVSVWGMYLKYIPATWHDPEEGGYFEVDNYKVDCNGINVTELIDSADVQRWVNEDFY